MIVANGPRARRNAQQKLDADGLDENPVIQASEFNVTATTILGSVQYRNVIIKRTNGANIGYPIIRLEFTT